MEFLVQLRRSAGLHVSALRSNDFALRIAKGAFWSLIGTMGPRALGLLASVVTARLLGRDTFGGLGIVHSTVEMFGVFAGLGLGVTATKYIAEHHRTDPLRASRVMTFTGFISVVTGLVGTLLLVAFADVIATHALDAPQLGPLLRLASPIILLNTLNGAQIGAMAGLEAFKRTAQVSVVCGVFTPLLMIVGVRWYGMEGAVVASIVSLALSWLLNHLALREEAATAGMSFIYDGAFAEARLLLAFTLPVFLSSMVLAPVQWMCNAILVNQPNGLSEMGVFAAVSQWRAVIMLVPSLLMRAALPIISSATKGDSGNAAIKASVNTTQSLNLLFVFPIATAVLFGGEWITRLYGKQFVGGGPAMAGLALSFMILSIGSSGGTLLQARGKVWLGLAINLCYGICLVVITALAAPRWGAAAITFGSAASYVFVALWSFYRLKRDLPQGMLKRVYLSLLCAVSVATIYCITPATYAAAIAPIAVLAVTWITWRYLIDPRSVSATSNG
jgi:O-antigen/teichoic acid export membrane protein